MSVSLNQFVEDRQRRLIAFREEWLRRNFIDPESYPLELPDDDAGAWHEMFDSLDLEDG